MERQVYHTYEEATKDYLARFRALRDARPAGNRAVTRGAADIPVETLIDHAEVIADISEKMAPLAQVYLQAPDPALREGISGQLLAQAAAELQVATELMQIAASETAGPPSAAERAPRGITRAARGASLREAIDNMEKAMAKTVSAGLVAPSKARRAPKAADTPETAKKALQQAATVTASAISQRVVEVGGDLAFKLVFKTEWSAVMESAGLLSKDIAKVFDRVKEGASALIQHAISTATRTVLNVYDKILALLGREVEGEARKRIKAWLDEIQKTGKIELFEKLVGKLYKVDALDAALPGWLAKTAAGVEVINATAITVAALSDKFTVLVGRINTIGDVIGLSKFVQAQFPQVLAVVTALRVALLAVLVYAGYDYIGYEQIRFPNLTKGVAEVVKENLIPGA